MIPIDNQVWKPLAPIAFFAGDAKQNLALAVIFSLQTLSKGKSLWTGRAHFCVLALVVSYPPNKFYHHLLWAVWSPTLKLYPFSETTPTLTSFSFQIQWQPEVTIIKSTYLPYSFMFSLQPYHVCQIGISLMPPSQFWGHPKLNIKKTIMFLENIKSRLSYTMNINQIFYFMC